MLWQHSSTAIFSKAGREDSFGFAGSLDEILRPQNSTSPDASARRPYLVSLL